MFEPDKWTIFAAAIVGAAAALMGRFVVAISVRLDIVTTRRAAARRGDQTLLEFILTAGTFGVGLLLLDRRALTQRASTDHLSRIVHGLSPNLMVTIGPVLAGGSLAIEWGGGPYWLVPTVILSVLGGVFSAWLFLVEQV